MTTKLANEWGMTFIVVVYERSLGTQMKKMTLIEFSDTKSCERIVCMLHVMAMYTLGLLAGSTFLPRKLVCKKACIQIMKMN